MNCIVVSSRVEGVKVIVSRLVLQRRKTARWPLHQVSTVDLHLQEKKNINTNQSDNKNIHHLIIHIFLHDYL